jgi:exodeoxyribonuclease VII large subunit
VESAHTRVFAEIAAIGYVESTVILTMDIYIEKLEGLSPLRKLNKGYALVLNSEDKVINSLDKITIGEMVRICLTDGDVIAKVEEQIKKERS